MPELLETIQTSWANIRIALYRRDDGFFQFIEECLSADGHSWQDLEISGLYDQLAAAKVDMVAYAKYAETL